MTFKPLITTAAIAAFALLSASTVFASEGSDDALKGYTPSKTRAQVLAELQQAKLDGTIHAADLNYREPALSVAARAQVKAETRQAIARGNIDLISREQALYLPLRSATTAAGH